MIEKKIRKFFNSVSVPSCKCKMCEEEIEYTEEMGEEIEVTPEETSEKPKLCDYARFMAKTFLILASVLVVGKTVAFLVDAVSGEEDDED